MFQALAQITSLVVMAMGWLVLIGWGFDIQLLKSISPEWVTMKPNTALGFVLAGLSLHLLQAAKPAQNRLAQGLALGVIGLGGLTLSQDLMGWNWGIDQLLFPDDLHPIETANPGRMAPGTAFNFLLIGVALWLSTGRKIPYRWVQGLTLLASLNALQVLIGYLYGVRPLLAPAAFTHTALHTTLLFLMLSAGVWFTAPTQGWMDLIASNTAGGITARLLLPAAVVIPIAMEWFGMLAKQAHLFNPASGLSLHVIGNVIAFTGFVGYCTKRLYSIDLRRRQAENALRVAYDALEVKVEQRTAELYQVNQALYQEIWDRRQAEAERDQFFTLSLDMLCIAGTDGYFKQLNPAWERTLGYSRAELMARSFIDFVHPNDQEKTRKEVADHAAGSPSPRFENRYRCKDGTYKWLSWTSVANPEAGLLYAVARDVSIQKQAEVALNTLNQELQRALAESQTLLEVIPIGIGIATDPECRTIRVNPSFAQQLGIPATINASLSAPEDERPTSFKVYQGNRELTPEELPLQYAATHGVEVQDFEVDVVWEDGTVVTLLEYAAPLFDEQGAVRGSVGAFLDITARKQADEAVRQLNATLEQRVQERTAQLTEVNQELKRFNYTVSHDLRSPLHAIQGLIEVLVEDYGDRLDEMGREYARHIANSARRMDLLIQDLLTYSRLTQVEIQLQTVNLTMVMQEVLSQLEPECQAKQAEIQVTWPLPPVKGQRTLLSQVLTNLLTNALKYVAPGVLPQVQVWAEQRQDQVRLWIADNGIGIEPDYQEQIFGVFERLHPAESYSGTGVGLAIVQKGIERMGGKVGVESQLDQGSRFWIELPLA